MRTRAIYLPTSNDNVCDSIKQSRSACAYNIRIDVFFFYIFSLHIITAFSRFLLRPRPSDAQDAYFNTHTHTGRSVHSYGTRARQLSRTRRSIRNKELTSAENNVYRLLKTAALARSTVVVPRGFTRRFRILLPGTPTRRFFFSPLYLFIRFE